MIALLSPSKNLNENPVDIVKMHSTPQFLNESKAIIEVLRSFSPSELERLMKINTKLAHLNFDRYVKWSDTIDDSIAKRAILMFSGEVFNGIKASDFSAEDLEYSQPYVRILSGLYGGLRPLDLIHPYRLEMGTNLKVGNKNNLYDFWENKISENILSELSGHKQKVIINLASDEYFKVVKSLDKEVRIIKCQFKEERNGKLKFVTIYGKKARGLMLRFMIRNRIQDPEDLKAFDLEGYYFNPDYSSKDNWMFSR